jgi:hypothetical protein
LSVARATCGSVPAASFSTESGRARSSAAKTLGSAVGSGGTIGVASVTTTSRRTHRTVAPGSCGPKFTPTSPNGLWMAASVPGRRDAFGPKISWKLADGQGGRVSPSPASDDDTSDDDTSDDDTSDDDTSDDDAGAGPLDGPTEDGSGATPERADTEPGVAQPATMIAITALPAADVRFRITPLGRHSPRNGSLRRRVKRCPNLRCPSLHARAPLKQRAPRRPPGL